MTQIPSDLRYTPTHEWVRTETDGSVTVGLTDFAQDQLGDIVFVEFPKVGRHVAAGETIAVVESVKAASDIYAPVAGEVIATNQALSIVGRTSIVMPSARGSTSCGRARRRCGAADGCRDVSGHGDAAKGTA